MKKEHFLEKMPFLWTFWHFFVKKLQKSLNFLLTNGIKPAILSGVRKMICALELISKIITGWLRKAFFVKAEGSFKTSGNGVWDLFLHQNKKQRRELWPTP